MPSTTPTGTSPDQLNRRSNTPAARLRLRLWQRQALDAFLASDAPDFLAVATPGAGKTTFALTAARMTMANLPGRLVVVAPTQHLKEQWADAAQRFRLHLVTDWRPGDVVPGDAHGIVTTYQQVGSSPEPFFALSQGGFVVLDEVHHAGEERTWGDGVRTGFDGAARRLALSGTPFRSDTQSIPFVRYDNDVVVPDIEYGYGQALADGRVVRPVFFPRYGGFMEWTAPDGAVLAASFDDTLARTHANQRLRAALSLDGEWLPTVIGEANRQLAKIRDVHEDAGGLVIATDQDHARGIADLLRHRFGVTPVVATSEDSDASKRIAAFADGSDPWIVAVRMVSEGVDIPRLRVGVYATTTTTELFFRQAVGRIVRHIPGRGRQRAYMFMPDDPRLRHYGYTIADARRHSLRKEGGREADSGEELDERSEADNGDQMSLFSVLSATATDADTHGHEVHDVMTDHDEPEFGGDDDGEIDGATHPSGAGTLVVDLEQLPPPAVGGTGGPSGLGFDRNERDRLRRVNTDLTRELVDVTGRPHSQVNAELNRQAGVSKVSEATIRQLDRRRRVAEDWLQKEHRRRRFARFV